MLGLHWWHAGFFVVVCGLSCGMWDLVPWPGIELEPAVLEMRSLGQWADREVLWMITDALVVGQNDQGTWSILWPSSFFFTPSWLGNGGWVGYVGAEGWPSSRESWATEGKSLRRGHTRTHTHTPPVWEEVERQRGQLLMLSTSLSSFVYFKINFLMIK